MKPKYISMALTAVVIFVIIAVVTAH